MERLKGRKEGDVERQRKEKKAKKEGNNERREV